MTRYAFLAMISAAALAACADGGGKSKNEPAAQPQQMSQPAPPDVGFSSSVSDAAVDACRTRLDSQTDGTIEVTGTEFSEANSAVYMVVGGNRAPWKCLIDADGRGEPYLEFIGDEGAM